MDLVDGGRDGEQALLSGLIRIYVLYHACQEPIFGRAQGLAIPQWKIQRLADEKIVKRVLPKQFHREATRHTQLPGGRIEPRVQSEIAILIQTFRGSRRRWRNLKVERQQPLRTVHARSKPKNVRLQRHRKVVAVHRGMCRRNSHEIR